MSEEQATYSALAETVHIGPLTLEQRQVLLNKLADSGLPISTLGYRPTPAECIAMGGHCWNAPISLYWFPAGEQFHPRERICKHCDHKQRGVPQEPVKWEDAP